MSVLDPCYRRLSCDSPSVYSRRSSHPLELSQEGHSRKRYYQVGEGVDRPAEVREVSRCDGRRPSSVSSQSCGDTGGTSRTSLRVTDYGSHYGRIGNRTLSQSASLKSETRNTEGFVEGHEQEGKKCLTRDQVFAQKEVVGWTRMTSEETGTQSLFSRVFSRSVEGEASSREEIP